MYVCCHVGSCFPISLRNLLRDFEVLLTVHLSIFISVINQLDAQTFCDTRGCVMQFLPPDDEHMCSKHVEA